MNYELRITATKIYNVSKAPRPWSWYTPGDTSARHRTLINTVRPPPVFGRVGPAVRGTWKIRDDKLRKATLLRIKNISVALRSPRSVHGEVITIRESVLYTYIRWRFIVCPIEKNNRPAMYSDRASTNDSRTDDTTRRRVRRDLIKYARAFFFHLRSSHFVLKPHFVGVAIEFRRTQSHSVSGRVNVIMTVWIDFFLFFSPPTETRIEIYDRVMSWWVYETTENRFRRVRVGKPHLYIYIHAN